MERHSPSPKRKTVKAEYCTYQSSYLHTRKMKTFQNTKKLKELVSTQPILEIKLKGVLYIETQKDNYHYERMWRQKLVPVKIQKKSIEIFTEKRQSQLITLSGLHSPIKDIDWLNGLDNMINLFAAHRKHILST